MRRMMPDLPRPGQGLSIPRLRRPRPCYAAVLLCGPMAWFYLGIAGLLEVAWAVGLKLSDGFRKPLIAAPTVVGMVLSFYFLALALRTLPLGTAYATWTGIGALGTLVVGMLCFDEPFGWLRVLFAALAIGGLAGLKATSGH